MRYAGCLIMLLCLLAGQAHALCLGMNLANVTLTRTFSGSGGAGYDSFDASTYGQTVNFDVQGTITIGPCQYLVVLRTGQSGDGANRYLNLNGNHLPYNVYTDNTYANVLHPAATATVSNVIFGTLPVGTTTQNKSFNWKIPPGTVVPANASYYTDNGVVLELWEGVLGLIPVLRDTASLNFQAKVDTKVDIAIVNTNANFNSSSTNRTVNLGNVSTGANQSFDFSIRSNSGYSVTVQSANKQVLKQVGVSTSIPYSITVGGVARNLSSSTPVQVAVQAGGTTASTGTNVPVKVTLGTITGAETSGTYQDNLSVTVSAN